MNTAINKLKSSYLLNENIANDLLSSEAKHYNLKCYPKLTKKEILVDQWSAQLIVILQRFQNKLITSYSHMKDSSHMSKTLQILNRKSTAWKKFLTTTSCNHWFTFPAYKYSKQARSWNCGHNPENKKYGN